MKPTAFIFFILVSVSFYGQEREAVDFLRRYELDAAQSMILQIETDFQAPLLWQLNMLYKFDFSSGVSPPQSNLTSTSVYSNFYQLVNEGDFLFYSMEGENLKALEKYQEALQYAEKNDNVQLACEALKKILTLHRIYYLYDNQTYTQYLEKYGSLAYDDFEMANYHYYNLILNFKNYYTDQWKLASQEWLDTYFKTHKEPYLMARVYNVYASYYEELEQYDKTNVYIEKAATAYDKVPYKFKRTRVNQLLAFGARIAASQNKTDAMARYLADFDTTLANKTDLQFKSLYHYYSSVLDTFQGDYKSAYHNYYKYEVSQDSSRRYRYDNLLNDLEVKYQTAEKEKQLLVEKQRATANRNALIAALLLLLVGAVVSVLLQKNTAKKRQLAEQEALLKQERVDNLLKQQELLSIDAMISGQEKERQRVANELHDDLGSLMATIKLHFDNSKISKKDPALKNAQKLLEEAYQKIRGMAHTKNSGVMSDQGLLPAIKKMAQVITETNALEVTVENFGMGDRLENSLELNLFRMVQELLANAIKHAQASKVVIQLTQHKDSLNIIIEDNGKGFDRSKVVTNDTGMGLTTIEKRIEHLEGSFTVDSILGKGTSILIDIPV